MQKRTVWLEDVCQIARIDDIVASQTPFWRRRVGQLIGFTLMKPRLPLVMDLNTLGQIAQLNEQKRLRKELEEQNEIARRTARASQTASQPASIPHATDKAGPCCAVTI